MLGSIPTIEPIPYDDQRMGLVRHRVIRCVARGIPQPMACLQQAIYGGQPDRATVANASPGTVGIIHHTSGEIA